VWVGQRRPAGGWEAEGCCYAVSWRGRAARVCLFRFYAIALFFMGEPLNYARDCGKLLFDTD